MSKKESSKNSELLKTAKKRFQQGAEAWSEIFKNALDDLKFRAGEQWPDDIRAMRERTNKPCLTINRIPQFIRQLTNDQRQNRPSIKVNPFDDKADVDTAKIFQGLIRNIEVSSNADVAYDTAFEGGAGTGIGFFRLVTQYESPISFNQELRIKRIRNPQNVILDPHSQEPDGSDANWGFVFEEMSRDEFRAKYKDSELSMMNDWRSLASTYSGWVSEDTCRIAEYFYKEFEETEIALLINGEVIEVSKLPADIPSNQIQAKRTAQMPKVKWCILNGFEVLEETEWPSEFIPIIPVIGDELDVDGKRILEGIVRHAKDPQRMYNYWATNETETIALAPKAPFIGAEGQFEGHESKWQTANIQNHAYLEYKPVSLNGQPMPPPQRNVFEPPVQGITNARMLSVEDMKATTGMYDAALGNRSNEASGVAIQRRAAQAQTSNYHFIDNLSRSIRHCGRILIDAIPRVYDTARAIRILGEDGEPELVMINQIFNHNGQNKLYNFGAGKYDVSVAVGPSFATKRQEAVASMLDLTKSYPQVAQVAGDLMVRNMDWPGAQEIADRLKKMLPPNIVDDKKDQALPPQAQAQIEQLGMMIEQLTAQLNEANEKINTKSIELESKERIEFAKIQAQIEIKMAELNSKESMTLLENEVREIQERLSALRYNEPIQPIYNDAGFDEQGFASMNNQQPTDGLTSGNPMENDHVY